MSRRVGIHPTALIGAFPEDRAWLADDQIGQYPRAEWLADTDDRAGWRPHIHPTAYIGAYCTIDAGTERNTRIGARTWLMKSVHCGHDCVIGDDVEIAPHTVLGGWAEVGDRAKLGIGALVLPYRRIGEGATVGAGAVVTQDVSPGAVVVGNPAYELPGKNPVPYSDRR